MGEVRALTQEDKDLFWLVVEDCLHWFHFMGREEAARKAADLRQRIEHPPEEIVRKVFQEPRDSLEDIFYNNEPFGVACDMVGRELCVQDYDWRYQEIIQKRGW